MSGVMGAEAGMVAVVRKKFEKLERTCMERYQGREQRVLSTLSYCMTALEQLQSWAVFAIFPTDEQNSDKYVGFVEQRFQCVIKPLRMFHTAIQREATGSPTGSQYSRAHGSGSGTGAHASDSGSISSRGSSPTNFASPRSPRSHGSDPRSPVRCRSPADMYSPRPPAEHRSGSSSDSGLGAEVRGQAGGGGSLRERTNAICQMYLEEGHFVKRIVLHRLQKCRKDLRTIYRWGQASLMDLHDVIDEALADELYFLVRGKMQRVLATISAFEESAEMIEKTLTQLQQGGGGTAEGAVQEPEMGYHGDNLDLRLDLQSADSDDVGYGEMGSAERRLYLDDMNSDVRGHVPRVGSFSAREMSTGSHSSREAAAFLSSRGISGEGDDLSRGHAVDSNSEDGSNPEPPSSPRPKGLVNHPKIMQDKLRSFALPSKFTGLRLSTTW